MRNLEIRTTRHEEMVDLTAAIREAHPPMAASRLAECGGLCLREAGNVIGRTMAWKDTSRPCRRQR